MISIIITAFREEKTIGKAIKSFIDQDLENYEIIVIAPDEETLNEAKRYDVKTLTDPGKGKPTALNIAIEKAEGNIIILTDGDVFVGENSVKNLLKKFKDDVGAVSGHPISTSNRNTFLGYISHLLTDMADTVRKKLISKGKLIACSGYLYAIKSGIIKEMPIDILADDAYASRIIHNAGHKIEYAEDALVYVKYPDNLEDWMKQKIRSTGAYEQLKKMFGKKIMRSFTQEAFGVLNVLKYPKNIKEFFWTIELIFLRLYLWIRIFIDIKIRKLSFEKTWVRIESTK